MADCETINSMLGAYADGELAAAEREAVKAHLAVCTSCSEELAGIQEIDRLAGALKAPTVTDAQWARCWSGVRQSLGPSVAQEAKREPIRIFQHRTVRLAMKLAAAVLVIAGVAVYWIWKSRPPVDTGETLLSPVVHTDSAEHTVMYSLAKRKAAMVIWVLHQPGEEKETEGGDKQ